jgi:hypothetical protein
MMISGIVADHGELLFGLQADDGLVQHDMVEHAAQGVAGLAGSVADGRLDGFADGDAQAAGRVRVLGQHPVRPWSRAGRGDALAAPGLHHGLAIGLLVEADAHHEYLAGQAELGAGKGKRAAPLAGTGFGGNLLDAENLVVVGLGDGGVGLVAARRAQAFIFDNKF